jgi:hypothetical protein
MPVPQTTSLGTRLGPLLNGGFFRPLARPTAAVYVDCAERLVEAADESGLKRERKRSSAMAATLTWR